MRSDSIHHQSNRSSRKYELIRKLKVEDQTRHLISRGVEIMTSLPALAWSSVVPKAKTACLHARDLSVSRA
jgi:hypothetical protein